MKSSGIQLAVVLGAALALRLVAGWCWQSRLPERFGLGDSDGYWVLARAIARGAPYQYGSAEGRVFRTPGYPLVLAPLFLFSKGEPPVCLARALSAVLGTIAVGGVYWLGARLFDRRAGLLAAALAAIEPGSVAAGVLVLSEAPFVPLMILQIGLWIAAWNAMSVRRRTVLALSAGLAGGAASLMRPSWLLFTPLAVAVGMVAGCKSTDPSFQRHSRPPDEAGLEQHMVVTKPRRKHAAIGASMLIGLVAAMLPWWIRNARVTGHFVPTTLQVGASLYDGWSPQATGASDMSFVNRFVGEERQRKGDEDGGADSLEYRLDRRMRQEAIAWARAHPRRVLELAAVKLTRMWNIWPNEPRLSSWPIRLAVLVTFAPILALGIWGAVKTLRGGWPYVLCWLPAVYFSLLHTVFVSSIRYRQPPLMLVIVLAAGVASGWRLSQKGDRP